MALQLNAPHEGERFKGFFGITFALAKERFGYDGKMMGVYAPPVPNKGAAGRLWAVCGLDDGVSISWAFGSRLDHGNGRLVGVALEQRI